MQMHKTEALHSSIDLNLEGLRLKLDLFIIRSCMRSYKLWYVNYAKTASKQLNNDTRMQGEQSKQICQRGMQVASCVRRAQEVASRVDLLARQRGHTVMSSSRTRCFRSGIRIGICAIKHNKLTQVECLRAALTRRVRACTPPDRRLVTISPCSFGSSYCSSADGPIRSIKLVGGVPSSPVLEVRRQFGCFNLPILKPSETKMSGGERLVWPIIDFSSSLVVAGTNEEELKMVGWTK